MITFKHFLTEDKKHILTHARMLGIQAGSDNMSLKDAKEHIVSGLKQKFPEFSEKHPHFHEAMLASREAYGIHDTTPENEKLKLRNLPNMYMLIRKK